MCKGKKESKIRNKYNKFLLDCLAYIKKKLKRKDWFKFVVLFNCLLRKGKIFQRGGGL